jgi:hypothetical protein
MYLLLLVVDVDVVVVSQFVRVARLAARLMQEHMFIVDA